MLVPRRKRRTQTREPDMIFPAAPNPIDQILDDYFSRRPNQITLCRCCGCRMGSAESKGATETEIVYSKCRGCSYLLRVRTWVEVW